MTDDLVAKCKRCGAPLTEHEACGIHSAAEIERLGAVEEIRYHERTVAETKLLNSLRTDLAKSKAERDEWKESALLLGEQLNIETKARRSIVAERNSMRNMVRDLCLNHGDNCQCRFCSVVFHMDDVRGKR